MLGEHAELERQYRKNLMIVSMIVLIYSIAGGAFDHDISFSGAKLTFSRPKWIEYFMIAIMLFLQWRHWLVSREIRRQHTNEVLKELYLPGHHIHHFKYIFNPGVTFANSVEDGFAILNDGGEKGRVKIQIKGVYFSFIIVKVVGDGNYRVRGELSALALTNDAPRDIGSPHILSVRESDVVKTKLNEDIYTSLSIRFSKMIPFLTLNITYRVRWLYLSYKEVWFGDSLLPAFVTCTALVSYALSKSFS